MSPKIGEQTGVEIIVAFCLESWFNVPGVYVNFQAENHLSLVYTGEKEKQSKIVQ